MDDLNSIQSTFSAGLFVVAALIIALAVLGFCFRCCTHPCYAWIYGITMFPVWLVLFVLGGVAVSVATAGDEDLQKACNDLSAELTAQISSGDSDSSVKLDLDIYSAIKIDEYMCSQYCKCDTVGATLGWNALTQEELTDTYKTTRIAGSFDFTGTVTSYDDCISTAPEPSTLLTADFYFFAKGFREQTDFAAIEEWIAFFEEQYTCAGICQPALFFWKEPIAIGVP